MAISCQSLHFGQKMRSLEPAICARNRSQVSPLGKAWVQRISVWATSVLQCQFAGSVSLGS